MFSIAGKCGAPICEHAGVRVWRRKKQIHLVLVYEAVLLLYRCLKDRFVHLRGSVNISLKKLHQYFLQLMLNKSLPLNGEAWTTEFKLCQKYPEGIVTASYFHSNPPESYRNNSLGTNTWCLSFSCPETRFCLKSFIFILLDLFWMWILESLLNINI